jgi:hypothetical protein
MVRLNKKKKKKKKKKKRNKKKNGPDLTGVLDNTLMGDILARTKPNRKQRMER